MSSLEVVEEIQKHHDWRIKRMEDAVTNLADTVNKFITSQSVINNETKLKIALASGAVSVIISVTTTVLVKLWSN